MAIARMLVRSGLLMLVLTSAAAAAKGFCRIMRSPSLSDTGPRRQESERARTRSASRSGRQSPPPRCVKSRRGKRALSSAR